MAVGDDDTKKRDNYDKEAESDLKMPQYRIEGSGSDNKEKQGSKKRGKKVEKKPDRGEEDESK
jgi:hypothetical protein